MILDYIVLNNHTSNVTCLTILKDGRLVSGSRDDSIIIYNKETYKSDLKIREHGNSVYCLTTLSSGILASCSYDETIKLFNIKDKEYNVLQTFNFHSAIVYKIIELKNKNLVSCSGDKSITFYIKDNNNEYIKDYNIPTNGGCSSVIQTKENEICYSEKNNNSICFFNLNQRKIKSSLNNINKFNDKYEWFIMIKKDLLLIPGINKISFINIKKYELIRIIDVSNSKEIVGTCIINENILFTGNKNGIIRQWKIEGDNLNLISIKENAHNDTIYSLINIGNGYFASGSFDKSIKIWQK